MPLLSTRGAASARGFGFQGGGGPYSIDYLVVAGGGGGGGFGGGGGAGGYRTESGYKVTLLNNYTITIGGGRQQLLRDHA